MHFLHFSSAFYQVLIQVCVPPAEHQGRDCSANSALAPLTRYDCICVFCEGSEGESQEEPDDSVHMSAAATDAPPGSSNDLPLSPPVSLKLIKQSGNKGNFQNDGLRNIQILVILLQAQTKKV